MKYRPLLTVLVLFAILFFINSVHSQNFVKFKDEKRKIIIEMPKTWNLKTTDDGKTVQMFISLEYLIKETDNFTVGATIIKIRRMSKSYKHVKSDEDIINVWGAAVIESEKKHFKVEEIKTGHFNSGNYVGNIREIKFQPTESSHIIHMYKIILAYEDNLVTVTFEAPESKWHEYYKIFNRGMMSLYLK